MRVSPFLRVRENRAARMTEIGRVGIRRRRSGFPAHGIEQQPTDREASGTS